MDAEDDRIISLQIAKADKADDLLSVKDVTYDTSTGVFVFTWGNGNTLQVDLNIEKIPVSFSMDEDGVITMTTSDGTTYTADIGSLITNYSFEDSAEVNFTETTDENGIHTITASIVSGSITGDKLEPNYLASCVTAKTGAETAAAGSQTQALISEGYAAGTQNGEPVGTTSPYYHNNAKYYKDQANPELLGSLADVDINNPSDGDALVYNATTEKWENGQGGGGTSNYNDLTNKPQIAGVTLSGNKSLSDLGIAAAADIPTALADLTDDSTHRTVTDAEKSAWDAKADTSDIPTTLAELTGDSTHRTVTDAEKTAWNGKQDADTVLTATLTAGQTTVTFTNAAITSTALIDIYTDTFGVNPTNATQSETTLTLTFSAQQNDLSVKAVIKGV